MLLKIVVTLTCIVGLVLFGEMSLMAARPEPAHPEEQPPKFEHGKTGQASVDCDDVAALSPAAIDLSDAKGGEPRSAVQ